MELSLFGPYRKEGLTRCDRALIGQRRCHNGGTTWIRYGAKFSIVI